MFFSIGDRIFEIRKIHIFWGIFSLLFLIGLFFIPRKWFSQIFNILWENLVYMAIFLIVVLLVFLFTKLSIFSKILSELKTKERFVEIGEDMENTSKRAVWLSFVVIIFAAGVFAILHYGMPEFSMDLNIKKSLIEKEPSYEKPGPVETTETTTTSTTTTTEKKKTGFLFFNKKEKEYNGPLDCSFGGRGHEAILMPSGHYYCRSTENRVPIEIDGVEVICCVTP